jgi:hypothetical protein
MGIEPPNIYAQRKGIINYRNLRSNHSWQTFAVSRILMDEAYIGDMVQGKSTTINHKQYDVPPEKWITVHDTHEALISREMFTAVQEYRKQVAENAKAKPINPYTPNIFKGKIFCGHCGGSLHRHRGWKRKGASEIMFVFTCLSNFRKARGSCKSYTLPEDELIPALMTSIQKYAEAVLGKSVKLRLNNEAVETSRNAVKTELASLKQENAKSERMKKSLYESLVSGLITADEYREMREGYEAKAKANLDRSNELESRQREIEQQAVEYCELSELAKKADANGVTAELIDRLIERIDVFSDKSIAVKFKFDSEVTVNE